MRDNEEESATRGRASIEVNVMRREREGGGGAQRKQGREGEKEAREEGKRHNRRKMEGKLNEWHDSSWKWQQGTPVGVCVCVCVCVLFNGVVA